MRWIKRNLIRVASYLLLIGGCYATGCFCLKKTKGFSILSISSHRPYNPSWETHPLSEAELPILSDALNQTYSYMACGAQCYVFASDNGKYVLKLFKQKALTPPPYLDIFPLPFFLQRYRTKMFEKRTGKLSRDFASYKIAFDWLKEETGVIYVHLNKTHSLGKTLKLTDKIGIAHLLQWDDLDFVLQHRAELVHARINRSMKSGDLQLAKESIDAVYGLILARCQKGFGDRDPSIETNCGFVNGRAIKLDVGRLAPHDQMHMPSVYKQEMQLVGAPFRAWLAAIHPTLIPYFDEKWHEMLD